MSSAKASDDVQMAHREIREIMMTFRHLRIANNVDATAFIFDSTLSTDTDSASQVTSYSRHRLIKLFRVFHSCSS